MNGFGELEEIERELKVAGKGVVGDSMGLSWPLILEWQLIYANLPFNQIRWTAAICSIPPIRKCLLVGPHNGHCCLSSPHFLPGETVIPTLVIPGDPYPHYIFGNRFLLSHRRILKWHLRSPVLTRSRIMSKVRQSNKEPKKQPVMTPKEKKAAKHAKKHASDVVPLIVR